MPTLNGDQAVSAALARITNQPGGCLATVWQFYGSHPSTGPHAGQYPDAIDGWAYATRRHPGDFHPPAGYPVYFDALPRPRYAGDDNYPSGDVVISIGGGLVRCTDGAGAGRMGTMTIAQRAAQIGRVYLGWTEDFLGYDVVTTAGASLNATPISTTPTGDEFDMASLDDLKTIVNTAVATAVSTLNDRIAASEARNRRESRARVYKRADGTLWIAGPTVVPRQVLADTPQRNDQNILKGDTLLVDAGDFASPQPISDLAWSVLIDEHDRFRNAIADAVIAKLPVK